MCPVSDDDKPVNETPDGENPDGENTSSSAPATPTEPPRFWGSPAPQKPVDPAEFGVSSTPAQEPEDTTPSWIQPQVTPPPADEVPPQQPPSDTWQSAMPPPMDTPPQQPPSGAPFNNVPVFQPPRALGSTRHFELRPFTVADILDNTFQMMKLKWKQIGATSLIYAVPAGLVAALSALAADSEEQNLLGQTVPYLADVNPEQSGFALAVSIIAGLLSLIMTVTLQPLVQGAVTRLVAANFVGREMGAKEAFNGVKHLWLVFAATTILTFLAMIGGLLVFLVGLIAAAVLFSAVIPIIAIEEEGVFNAMGRSWALMKRGFWRYLGAWIVIFILSMVIALAVGAIPSFLASALYRAHIDPLAFLVYAFGSTLSELVVFPISAIAATLMYFDARVRFEGFDVQLMAARLPQTPPEQQPPSAGPSGYGSGNF